MRLNEGKPIYTIDIRYGTQVVNAGTGGPSIWISLDDPSGTFRIGEVGGATIKAHVPFYGVDDAWHMLEESQNPFDSGAWWVRHVSWTQVEVEYRI